MKYIIDLNYNCNNDCVFCFNLYDKTKIFNLINVKKEIDKAKRNKIKCLDFYGGEPFLYKQDLIKALAYANKLGFKSSIATNSTLLDEYLVKQLNKYSVQSVRTTLHGHNKILHDLITQRTGSFHQTLRGLNLLIKYFKGEIVINIVVTKLNFKYLMLIIKLIEKLDTKKKIAIKLSNLVYNGDEKNYQKLAGEYCRIQPYLINIIKYLLDKKRGCYLEKFPYCIAKKSSDKFVKEAELDKEIIIWDELCEDCQYKNKGCVGFNINYVRYIRKIKNEAKILNNFNYG